MSLNFAARVQDKLRTIPWDLAVIDEAHKLRNAHRESHQTGQAIKKGLAGCRKLLLTATPLQNTLLELFGLSTVIDPHLFGDAVSFRSQYMRSEENLPALRRRLSDFITRTLRRDVLEYVRLLKALQTGFDHMAEMGAPRKVVIFTESRRTQDYLAHFLEAHGHADKVVTFSGTNNSPTITGIYQRWLKEHAGSDRITGSPAVDRRTAVIDHFRERGEILIATEAAAEGVNLQFCALVVNYDLPWNPQRVEQRIGRCHRYGQAFDVVVINFLNRRNDADRRVLELLSEKFHLFDGVFGASDEILGRIESGVDFEKRIAAIYDTCRTPEEIQSAFEALQKELETSIEARMRETEQKLLVHLLFRIRWEIV